MNKFLILILVTIVLPSLAVAAAPKLCAPQMIEESRIDAKFKQQRFAAGEISCAEASRGMLSLRSKQYQCGLISVGQFCSEAPSLINMLAHCTFDEFLFRQADFGLVDKTRNRSLSIQHICEAAALHGEVFAELP